MRSLAKMIDHSLLHPTMTDADIIKGCEAARKYCVATVCVKPYAIAMCKGALVGSEVGVCSVVAFPHGNSTTKMKVRETEDALERGATEIDMVVNIGKVLGGDWGYVSDEVGQVNHAGLAAGRAAVPAASAPCMACRSSARTNGFSNTPKTLRSCSTSFLTDEPSAAAFADGGRLVAYLRQRDPGRVAYINLFPTYANNQQLGTQGDTVTAYREHLRRYVEQVKPDLISYDHYHFAVNGDNGQYAILQVSNGRLFDSVMVHPAYAECDVLISLAKMKNHRSAGVTLSMKNNFGITPTGILAMDMARVEAGLFMIEVDYTSSSHAWIEVQKSTPFELGLDWAVSLDKQGYFVGRRALEREKREGSVWKLMGLEIEWNGMERLFADVGLPPQIPGMAIRASLPVLVGGVQVGYASTATWSPLLKKYIALAHLQKPWFEAGMNVSLEVTVEHHRRHAPAKVVALPFYEPEWKKK